jgi:hypothetical protein
MSNSPIPAAFLAFAKQVQLTSEEIQSIQGVFSMETGKELEAQAQLQKWLVNHPNCLPYGPFLFDLLLTEFIFKGSQISEEFFETEEWEAIEDSFAEEGSELLNLLLYLAEAVDTQSEISLDDYLDDFLLVDEDEFQDEHEIYREVILLRNQVDSAYPPMMEVLMKKKDESPLGSMFIPLFVLFYYPDELEFASAQLAKYAEALEEEQAVFAMIRGFVEGLK